MFLDITIAVLVLGSAYRGSWRGTMANVWAISGVIAAAWTARYLSRPVARWIVAGVEWPYGYAIGLSFLVSFAIGLLLTSFILGPSIQRAEQGTDGGVLDRLVASLLAGIKGAVLVYCVVCGVMLCTPRWGSQSARLAPQYHKSVSGRWLLSHNLVNVEPFPHARVLRLILGHETATEPSVSSAVYELQAHPMTEFLRSDTSLQADIWNRNWRAVRKHSALLALVTSPEFLKYVDAITTSRKTRAPEEPASRFKELR